MTAKRIQHALAWGIDSDGRREVRTVTDACSSPAWTYGSEDQDHEQGAILGARSHNQARTTADAHGVQTTVLGAKADPPDHFRRLVETYGLEVSASASGI